MGPRPLEASLPAQRPRTGAESVTVVLPGDLDARLAAFPATPADGQLLVLETRAKPKALPFHRQKLALVVSSLHHFVEERRALGFHVEHRVADDYATGVREFFGWARPARLHAVEPRDWAIDRRFRALSTTLPLTLHADGGPGGHFLITRKEFADWAGRQRQMRLDHFYQQMRRKFRILVSGNGKPEGGRWSYDEENRQHARGVEVPPIPWVEPDALTRRAMRWAAKVGVYGNVEPFGWPVTRDQALRWLRDFVEGRFPQFGPYEDAIRSDARFLFHGLLSSSLNLGLLHPREVVDAALEAYYAGRAPLASTEGFIRQVIGWREFIRGVYWQLIPGLREANQLGADRPLPDFFWDPDRTPSQCLKEALQAVRDTAYTHHIERLMVICNYATLAGLDPRAVSHWFWAAFIDAYEWVELPNVVGMAMYGTGAFTTKPYIASAAYIKRMSGLPAKGRGPRDTRHQAPCARCRFDPDQRIGPKACPYNAMYWDFLATHRPMMESNLRMRNLVRNLDRFGPEQLAAIRATAEAHRQSLPPPQPYHVDEDAG